MYFSTKADKDHNKLCEVIFLFREAVEYRLLKKKAKNFN